MNLESCPMFSTLFYNKVILVLFSTISQKKYYGVIDVYSYSEFQKIEQQVLVAQRETQTNKIN